MVAYLKRRRDFTTYGMAQVCGYSIAAESIYDNKSDVDIVGEYTGIEGDFLVTEDGFIGLIKEASPENGITTVSCNGTRSAFDRQLIYPGPGEYIEDFIATAFRENYQSTGDDDFDMPYLVIQEPETHTPFIKPEIEDDYLYSLKAYIAQVRRVKNVFVEFSVARDNLIVTIGRRAVATHNIDFNETAHKLVSEKYSNSGVAKITAVVDGAGTDYYLLEDGSVVTDPAGAPRATGTWETIVVKDAEDVPDKVSDTFAKNSHSHSIEFYTTKRLGFYDRLKIRLHGKVVNSYVSQIIRESSDGRYLIKSGELRTTLTEKSLEVE